MKLLNSKFNVGDIIKLNPMAENWYKTTFPENNGFTLKIVKDTCNEKFFVYDVVKFQRSGETHLYLQKMSELTIDPNATCVIFTIDKDGYSTDSKLCWFKFKEPLFVKDRS